MWFNIIKKEKTLEERVNSYIDIYGKIYKSNDIETINNLREEQNKLIRPLYGKDEFYEFVEAISEENFEQLSLEDFIQESTDIYLDSFNSDEKRYDRERDSILRYKVPIHKEKEFYDKLFKNSKFLEAMNNFDNYHKRIKEERENERRKQKRLAEAKRNQERMMALQRQRTSGKYKGRKGQRKQNRQTSQKKTRSQRQAASERKRREQARKDRERREDEQRRFRNERRGL